MFTYQQLLDALASAANKNPSDPIMIMGADGFQKTIVSIDHIEGSQGLFPTSEPNIAQYFKIQLGE